MSLFVDLLAAASARGPFSMNWKRARHIRHGHPFRASVPVDKLTSEKHPHSNREMIYTINLRTCLECGLTYHDAGLEPRP